MFRSIVASARLANRWACGRRSVTTLSAASKPSLFVSSVKRSVAPAVASSAAAPLMASGVQLKSSKSAAGGGGGVGGDAMWRGVKVNCGDLRVGHLIELDGHLYVVMSANVSKAAMRKSSLQLELKDVKTGSKVPHRCKHSDKVERTYISPYHIPHVTCQIPVHATHVHRQMPSHADVM